MCMHYIFPWRPEEGPRSFGTGVTDGCETPCGFWESNLGPLEKASARYHLSYLLIPSILKF